MAIQILLWRVHTWKKIRPTSVRNSSKIYSKFVRKLSEIVWNASKIRPKSSKIRPKCVQNLSEIVRNASKIRPKLSKNFQKSSEIREFFFKNSSKNHPKIRLKFYEMRLKFFQNHPKLVQNSTKIRPKFVQIHLKLVQNSINICQKSVYHNTPLRLSFKSVKHPKTISQFARVFSALAAIFTELWTFFGRRP